MQNQIREKPKRKQVCQNSPTPSAPAAIAVHSPVPLIQASNLDFVFLSFGLFVLCCLTKQPKTTVKVCILDAFAVLYFHAHLQLISVEN